MKNPLTLIIKLGFLFIITFSYAQPKFGIIAGVNIAGLTDKYQSINGEYFNFSSIGLNVGGYAEIKLSEKITLYPKLIYNQIGDRDYENEYTFYGDPYELDYKLDYLSLPLNITFFKNPYVLIGPQFGILLKSESEYEHQKDIEENTDIGMNFGIGYIVNDFRFEISIYQGITNILELPVGPSDDIFEVRNQYLNFSLGYTIFN